MTVGGVTRQVMYIFITIKRGIEYILDELFLFYGFGFFPQVDVLPLKVVHIGYTTHNYLIQRKVF